MDIKVYLTSTSEAYSIKELYDMTLLSYEKAQELTSRLFTPEQFSQLSDIEKLKIIYTYLTENITYPKDSILSDRHYTALSVFSDKVATCQAIASAFNILCRCANLNACAISFDNHAFNCVLTNGEYLFFDATYEITSKDFSATDIDKATLNYFALNHEKMQNIHGNFSLPLAFWCTLE